MIRIYTIIALLLLGSCKPHIKNGKYTFRSLFYTNTYNFKHKKVVSSYKSSGFPVVVNTYDYCLTDSSVIILDNENVIEEIKTIKVGNKILLDTAIYNDRNNW